MRRCDLIVTGAAEVWSPPPASHAPPRANARSAGAVWGQRQSEAVCLRGNALAIREGLIVDVAAAADIESDWDARETLALDGGCLTPALVDPHTHLVFAGERLAEFSKRMRGGPAGKDEPLGIEVTVAATRAAGDTELIDLVRARLDRALLGGCGTVEIKSGYALEADGELRLLRIARRAAAGHPVRVIHTLLAAHALPASYTGRASDFIEEVAIPATVAAHREGLAEFADIFVEPSAFPRSDASVYLSHARDLGFALRVHADQLECSGGAALAASFGAASADHLEHAGVDEISALAAAGTVAVLLPGAVLTLEGRGGSRPPARALIDAGVPVAIATDWNPGSSNAPSAVLGIGLACRLFGLAPEEAWNAATVNAAASLGLGRDVGRIAPGYRADISIWDAPAAAMLAYELDAHRPRHVLLGGRFAVRNGALTTAGSVSHARAV